MDDLLHHCLRELAFDGELGCNVSRLQEFVNDFYGSQSPTQLLDEHFMAFIWSLIVQHPTVRIGVRPHGLLSEVYIPPQNSAKRKAKTKGEDLPEIIAPTLTIIDDAKERSLKDLVVEFGESLRIAAEADAVFSAITGSHIRSPKLSPMVYAALQLITRGRDEGLSVVDLGQQSGYDQKTCFYLVRQLTELNLVVKVRRGGVGTNFCIHTYFYEHSPSWREIREEEFQAGHTRPATETDLNDAEPAAEDDSVAPLEFPPIDARHLSSLPLVRARLTKLLKMSKNNMHASNNILLTLGFANPTKTDRRFFQTRVRELVAQGIIEKVLVPKDSHGSTNGTVKCFRLLRDEDVPEEYSHNVVSQEMDDDDDDDLAESNGVQANVTIHKQITSLLELSGMEGMTLNDITAALDGFDKRTVELLLARAEKNSPPPHLSDLGVMSMAETYGKERRNRYMTISSFTQLMEKKLPAKSQPSNGVSPAAKGFSVLEQSLFYDDDDALVHYQDTFKEDGAGIKNKPKEAARRGHKRAAIDTEDMGAAAKRPKKRTRVQEGESTNLLLESDPKVVKKKRTTTASQKTDEPPKKRGRPRKVKVDNHAHPDKAETTKVDEMAIGPQSPSEVADVGVRISKPGEMAVDMPNPPDTITTGPSLSTYPALEETQGRTPCSEEDLGPQPSPTLQECTTKTSGSLTSRPLPQFQRVEDADASQTILVSDAARSDRRPNTSSISKEDTRSRDTFTVDTPANKQSGAPQLHSMKNIDPALLEAPIVNDGDNDGTPNDNNPNHPLALSPSGASESQTKSTFRSKVNIAQMRRETELWRVLEVAGGIINVSARAFFEIHANITETMHKAGEQTSVIPGTRMDKRTVNATYNNMESQGKIKIIRTSVITHTGSSRPVCVVFKADMESSRVNTYLKGLSRAPAASIPQPEVLTKIEEYMEFGSIKSLGRDSGRSQKEASTSETPCKEESNDQLFQRSDSSIRDVLLTERTTLSQSYGYIIGHARRARELHLQAIAAFERTASSYVTNAESRILDISFFQNDITLSAFCSVVSVLENSGELAAVLSTEDGRNTLLAEVSETLRSSLQIGRARAKTRVLEIMEALNSLKLVTPLRFTESTSPYVTCLDCDGQSLLFDIASHEGWTTSTPMAAPTHWQFHVAAPLHWWSLSQASPPFVKNASTRSYSECETFWIDLEHCCHNEPPPDFVPIQISTLVPPSTLGRFLRRPSAWNRNYVLAHLQRQYLMTFVDTKSGDTPLQADDGGEGELSRICWVSSAPDHAVRNFFETKREQILGHLSKVRKQKELADMGEDGAKKHEQEVKARLRKRAAESKRQKEKDWQQVVDRTCTVPITAPIAARLQRIRTRYLSSATANDEQKWKDEIAQAVRDASSATQRFSKTRVKRPPVVQIDVLPTPAISCNPPEKSVQALIEQQQQLISAQPAFDRTKRKPRKRKRNIADEEPESPPPKPENQIRRSRFQWNRDYEELARDAYAIVRARCREHGRLDFGAMDKILPAIPRNGLRGHINLIKESHGEEAYLKRLEDAWYDFWKKYRGTELLPDDNPASPSDFDIVKHVEVLRQHIDKISLRVGLQQFQKDAQDTLPAALEDLLETYDIEDSVAQVPAWDFMWNALKEEGRETTLLRQAFTQRSDEGFLVTESPSDLVQVAEAGLKMVIGTPKDEYEPEMAADLLKDIGDQQVTIATKELLSRGVFSKVSRDPSRPKPGRLLKFQETNSNTIGGPLHGDLFQDASALEETSADQDDAWREWPLVPTDGDIAALLQLASEDKVEFRIDSTGSQATRSSFDWNSKKTDDDDLETSVHVCFRGLTMPATDASTVPSVESISEDSADEEHGEGACCSLRSAATIVNCVACLKSAKSTLLTGFASEKRQAAERLLDLVSQTGQGGISEDEIIDQLSGHALQVHELLRTLGGGPSPLLYWVGYRSIVVVHAAHVSRWTVLLSENPKVRIFPRRWMSICGSKMSDVWNAALRAVIGTIMFKPGISHAELRWRLKATYDRQEIADVVHFLVGEKCIESRSVAVHSTSALIDSHEKSVHWFLHRQKRWYHAQDSSP